MSNAGSAILVQRGSCPFGIKAQHLQQAKAAAMLVANTDDGMKLSPSSLFVLEASLNMTLLLCWIMQIACLWTLT